MHSPRPSPGLQSKLRPFLHHSRELMPSPHPHYIRSSLPFPWGPCPVPTVNGIATGGKGSGRLRDTDLSCSYPSLTATSNPFFPSWAGAVATLHSPPTHTHTADRQRHLSS